MIPKTAKTPSAKSNTNDVSDIVDQSELGPIDPITNTPVQTDLRTGVIPALATGLSNPHGPASVPSVSAPRDPPDTWEQPTAHVDSARTPVVEGVHILASAPALSSAPDSITIGGGSIWVEYGNGSSSSGGGTSTVVQYSMQGQVENTYTAAGLADGLKYDAATGNVWVLNNNDDNSTLQFINPATQQISGVLTYGSPYVYGGGRGFDDVVFDGNRVFLSETNPSTTGDPVIVQLLNGQAPFGTLQTASILRFGDTGTNMVTGQTNQQLPMMDPDSLKLLPNGELLLTGEADGAYIFVKNPGTPQQTESFVNLPAGDIPDDAIMPTSRSGTFYISNQGSNNIVGVTVTGLDTHDLYADIANKNELVQIDPMTGAVVPILTTGLSSPHGLAFVPSVSDTGSDHGRAASLGQVGTDWSLGGFAADPPTGSMGGSGSTSQLVQAMAGFGGGSGAGESLNTAPLNAETSQQPLLTAPQHA
jgi:hypothetical protein